MAPMWKLGIQRKKKKSLVHSHRKKRKMIKMRKKRVMKRKMKKMRKMKRKQMTKGKGQDLGHQAMIDKGEVDLDQIIVGDDGQGQGQEKDPMQGDPGQEKDIKYHQGEVIQEGDQGHQDIDDQEVLKDLRENSHHQIVDLRALRVVAQIVLIQMIAMQIKDL